MGTVIQAPPNFLHLSLCTKPCPTSLPTTLTSRMWLTVTVLLWWEYWGDSVGWLTTSTLSEDGRTGIFASRRNGLDRGWHTNRSDGSLGDGVLFIVTNSSCECELVLKSY